MLRADWLLSSSTELPEKFAVRGYKEPSAKPGPPLNGCSQLRRAENLSPSRASPSVPGLAVFAFGRTSQLKQLSRQLASMRVRIASRKASRIRSESLTASARMYFDCLLCWRIDAIFLGTARETAP